MIFRSNNIHDILPSFQHSLIPDIFKIRRVLQITKRAGVPLIINDRVDVAMAIGAGTALLLSTVSTPTV